MSGRPGYSQVPRDLAERLGQVAGDPAAAWAYVRLWLVADALWPTRPDLPRWLDADVEQRLARAGLLDGRRTGYRLPALDGWRRGAITGRAVGGTRRWRKAQERGLIDPVTHRYTKTQQQPATPARGQQQGPATGASNGPATALLAQGQQQPATGQQRASSAEPATPATARYIQPANMAGPAGPPAIGARAGQDLRVDSGPTPVGAVLHDMGWYPPGEELPVEDDTDVG